MILTDFLRMLPRQDFRLLDRSGASSGHGPRHCQCRWFISDFVAGWFVVVWSIRTLIWLKNHPRLRLPLITMILSKHCVFLHFSESGTTVERPFTPIIVVERFHVSNLSVPFFAFVRKPT